MKQVAKEFQDVPVKLLAKNLEASTKLVTLISSCTDAYTAATLQEHLRWVVCTVRMTFEEFSYMYKI